MKVGTIVALRTPMLGEDVNSTGVVFYDYGTGSQVIFTDGGYDGFDASEQKDYLREIGFDEKTSNYQFKNVLQMERDYEAGAWNHVFQDKKYKVDRGF